MDVVENSAMEPLDRRCVVIDLDAEADVVSCEASLKLLRDSIDCDIVLRIVSTFSSKLFSDLWVAIVIASICTMHQHRLKIIAWGVFDWESSKYFQKSLPGVVALQMGQEIESDFSKDLLSSKQFFSERVRWQSSQHHSRTIYELDPQSEGEGPLNRLRLNDYLIDAASKIDLGYANKNKIVGSSISEMLSFFAELYENSYNYSKYFDENRYNIRFMRLKAHVYSTPGELVKRAGRDRSLKTYLESVVNNYGHHGVIEATVSDFGPGIVSHFLSSPKGGFYEALTREEILNLLLHTALSSKSDSGAGQGLPKVMKAAAGLRAYLSVRTNEFRLTKSFADKESSSTETSIEARNAEATGTHWQLLWPMMGLDSVFS